MPIQRFGSTLVSKGQFNGYMNLLRGAHRGQKGQRCRERKRRTRANRGCTHGRLARERNSTLGLSARIGRRSRAVRSGGWPHRPEPTEDGVEVLPLVEDRADGSEGEVTSGTQSPSLSKGIGMGYVQTGFSKPGTELYVNIRSKYLKAVVVKMPFIP